MRKIVVSMQKRRVIPSLMLRCKKIYLLNDVSYSFALLFLYLINENNFLLVLKDFFHVIE